MGLAAALMSGADSFVMMGSASLAKDIYQQYFRPNADSARMLRISRLCSVAICCMALAVALVGKGIIPVYLLVVKAMGAGLVFPFLALMFWRRATGRGVLAGMTAGLVITIGWRLIGSPWIMEAVFGYLACLIVMVVVSLLTQHAPDEKPAGLYYDSLHDLSRQPEATFSGVADQENTPRSDPLLVTDER